MTTPGLPPQDMRRSVTVVNHYAMAKRLGLIQPLVVDASPNAQFSQDGYRAFFTVRNLEPVALAFTSRRIELMFSDHRPAVMLNTEVLNVALPPKAETLIYVLSTKIPADAIGFAVHYAGIDSAKRPVRASAYFELPAHIARISPHLLANPALVSQLNNLVAQRQVLNLTTIKAQDILQVVQRGGLTPLPKAPPKPPGPPPKSDIVEGAVCDPWNLPANIPDGFVCQASTDPNDTTWLPMPGRFMNARKGDVIISAATPGDLIADLLLSIGQVYSHSGMTTANREQITHSTASKDRLLDYPNGSLVGTPAPAMASRSMSCAICGPASSLRQWKIQSMVKTSLIRKTLKKARHSISAGLARSAPWSIPRATMSRSWCIPWSSSPTLYRKPRPSAASCTPSPTGQPHKRLPPDNRQSLRNTRAIIASIAIPTRLPTKSHRTLLPRICPGGKGLTRRSEPRSFGWPCAKAGP